VACWGENSKGQAWPPVDDFQFVAAGTSRSCGLKADNSLNCWGEDWP
jgi:hypothetical protein